MSVIDEKTEIIKDIASRYFDPKESCVIDYREDYPSLAISVRGIINGNRVAFLYNLQTDLLYFPVSLFEQIMIKEIDDIFRNFKNPNNNKSDG